MTACEWCRSGEARPYFTVCGACWEYTAQQLDAAPGVLAQLRQNVPRQAPTGYRDDAGTSTTKAGPRSPAREEVIDAVAALCVTLCRWGGPEAGAHRTGPAGAVRAARWLRAHMRMAFTHQLGVTSAITLDQQMTTARRILGTGPSRLTAPCPHCDTRGLVLYGAGVVWCSYCQTKITEAEYQDHAHNVITTTIGGNE